MARRRRQRRRPPTALDGAGEAPASEPERGGALAEAASDKSEKQTPKTKRSSPAPARFAALDLGTNNCRLLIASPRPNGFRVFDAFSRIVRLGEGVSGSGALSEAAMARTMDALKICAEKIEKRAVTRQRCIATQACRAASNGVEFLERVHEETGLRLEIITPAEEARLSVAGCVELFDRDAAAGLIFDIGGGSTEISWVRPREKLNGANAGATEVVAWTSMPIGVVNLSERFGGREMSNDAYQKVVNAVRKEVAAFGDPGGLKEVFEKGDAHFLGTSGTVTSIAGVHLGLPRYRREAVDGLWLSERDVRLVTDRLREMSYEARADEPCIGVERADLVVCGCAILDALLLEWPASRVRVADRGLREGMLVGLARAHKRERERMRRRRRR